MNLEFGSLKYENDREFISIDIYKLQQIGRKSWTFVSGTDESLILISHTVKKLLHCGGHLNGKSFHLNGNHA